jgi:type II secretory pathway pseudopilin PulG
MKRNACIRVHIAPGFTLPELVVTLGLALVVSMLCAVLMAGAARAAFDQPMLADETQRLRAAFDQLSTTVMRGGEGLAGTGANAGVLLVPPLYPNRRGVTGADPDVRAFSDRLTVITATDPPTGGAIAWPMAARAAPILFGPASCGPGRVSCGVPTGGSVLVCDARARGEVCRVTLADGDRLEHAPLGATYGPSGDAMATGVEVRAIHFDAGRQQLRIASAGTDLPLLDDVAAFEVVWLGDTSAPAGPRPPPGEENCVVGVDGSLRLPALAADEGPWVRLEAAELSDGPWCGVQPWRFDADLYRVRMVRLRVQLRRTRAAAAAGRRWPGPPILDVRLAPPNLVRMR